jgi:uncharacterized protein (DUF302 family)
MTEEVRADMSQIRVVPRVVRQLTIDADRPFDIMRESYEKAVPPFDRMEAIGVTVSGGGWEGITHLSEATALHGLVTFFTFDPSPVMRLNGATRRAVTYVSGNIVKAEKGFRINPACIVYLPLRVVIAECDEDNSELTIDWPSDLISAFSDTGMSDVAQDFNRTIADLFEHLALPVPMELLDESAVTITGPNE